jgi:hypothetical protein
MSFFSVLAISLTAIIVTTIVSATGICLYGLRVVDKKSDSLVGLVEQAAIHLPEFRKALPPVLADALDDVRRPDYLEQLDVTVRKIEGDRRSDRRWAVVEIENLGDEIVSLLSMRIIGLDDNGDPVAECHAWAATPLQIEDDWRGPLLPGATRRFSVRSHHGHRSVELTHEITDIRVWNPSSPQQVTQTAQADFRADHPLAD